ncbi:hypothetical protein GCM10020331_047640 [Ectobacillus funiculus]
MLKERGGRLDGVEGAVAELITVPEKYETAIETALGAAAQHIVVQEEQHARGAIAFFEAASVWACYVFLPMTAIKGRYISSDILQTAQQHAAFYRCGV